MAVKVASSEPKFSPKIETEAAPHVGELYDSICVNTGESNVKSFTLVPTTADTVTCVCPCTVAVLAVIAAIPIGDVHRISVSETHTVEAQREEPMRAVGLTLLDAKFTPFSVRLAPPDVGAFIAVMEEITGESNEKILFKVPTTADIETKVPTLRPIPGGEVHITLVEVVHDVLAHIVEPILALGVIPVVAKLVPNRVMLL